MNERLVIGRERELAYLRAAAHRAAAASAGAIVVVEGAAGEGKSTVVDELASGTGADGFLVLRGQCSPVGTCLPFEPFVLALNQHALVAPPDQLERQLGGDVAVLRQLVPNLAKRLDASAAEPNGDLVGVGARLRQSFLSVFERLAADGPMVLVVEDLHWASGSTIELLTDLHARATTWPLLVVATVRPEHVSAADPVQVAVDLADGDRASRIRLGGLAEPEVRVLAERTAGRPIPTELLETIGRVTEGNPLFVIEYVSHLREHDALDAHWERLVVPASVQAVIAERIERLSDDSQRALQVAAMVGRDFSYELWATVSGLDEHRLAVAAADGMRAGVIEAVTPDVWSFSHALITDAFLAQLTAARRKRLHRKVAGALEAHYGSHAEDYAAELAHHYSSGGASVAKQAVRYGHLAGQQALLVGDWATSQHLLSTALHNVRMLPADPARATKEWELRLGLAAIELSGATSRPDDPDVTLSTSADHPASSLDALAHVLDLVDRAGPGSMSLIAISILGVLPLLSGKMRDAATLFRRGAALAEAIDSPGDVLVHSANLVLVLALSAELDEALEVIDGCDPLLATPIPGGAPYWQGGAQRALGEQPAAIFQIYGQEGLWLGGRFARAAEVDALCTEAIAAMPHDPDRFPLVVHAFVAMIKNDPSAARDRADQAADGGPGLGLNVTGLMGRLARGRARAMLGDDRGLPELEEALGWWQMAGVTGLAPIAWCWLAESQLDAGHPAEALASLTEAAAVVERSEQRSATPEIHRIRGDVLLAAARAGDDQARGAAERSYRAAATSAATLGVVPYALRAATGLAELLVDEGRDDEARTTLQAAILASTDPGTCPDLDRAREALDRMASAGAHRSR